MTRAPRKDEPGAILHITNRGVAHRPIFQTVQDVRYFKSRVAREHRSGRIRVHAFTVLSNHYHVIFQSLTAQISDSVRNIQNQYARRFNRQRRRDGPLFRGRFKSRRVESESYWFALLRYIDLHSEKSRITSHPGLYPHGSAIHYLTGEAPRWLTTDIVHELLTQGLQEYDPALYEAFLDRPLSVAERELIELRLRGEAVGDDCLDELLNGGTPGIRDWMMRRAANADGTEPGLALASPTRIAEVIARHRADQPEWVTCIGRDTKDVWTILAAGLLREASSLSCPEIAARLRLSISTAQRRVREHGKLTREAEEYRIRSAAILAEVLQDYAPPRGSPGRGLIIDPAE